MTDVKQQEALAVLDSWQRTMDNPNSNPLTIHHADIATLRAALTPPPPPQGVRVPLGMVALDANDVMALVDLCRSEKGYWGRMVVANSGGVFDEAKERAVAPYVEEERAWGQRMERLTAALAAALQQPPQADKPIAMHSAPKAEYPITAQVTGVERPPMQFVIDGQPPQAATVEECPFRQGTEIRWNGLRLKVMDVTQAAHGWTIEVRPAERPQGGYVDTDCFRLFVPKRGGTDG